MRLCHITTRDKVSSILSNGLRAMCGSNSTLIEDCRKAIYFCKEEQLGYWLPYLKGDVVVCVEIEAELLNCKTFGVQQEWYCTVNIPKEKIIEVHDVFFYGMVKTFKEALSVEIATISYEMYKVLCEKEHKTGTYDLYWFQSFMNIEPQYKRYVTAEFLREIFKELADSGEYTILDCAWNTTIPMYQVFHDTFTEEIAERVYTYILREFSDCLGMDTGCYEI